MKKALVAIAALLVSVSAYAQGQVVFNTHNTAATPPVDARVLNPDGSPATAGFGELVIVGANGSLTPMTTTTPAAFKTSANGAGYINAGGATAPAGFAGGTTVQLILRAWQGGAGSTYDTAAVKGQSSPISIALVEAPGTPNELIGLTGFTMVPEPTTLALGALGLGALLIRRRK
jgi:hypothetical protein